MLSDLKAFLDDPRGALFVFVALSVIAACVGGK
jgi:hypothetical protein